MLLKRYFAGLTALFSITLLSASCSELTGFGNDGSSSQCVSGIPTAATGETAYCPRVPLNNPVSSSAITITGTAKYEYREASSTGLGGGTPLPNNPIRFAEVRVTDANGNLIQCAETDNSGNFSFKISRTSEQRFISVTSRADNSTARVSVLDAPDTNQFYSISTPVVADGDKSVGTLLAEGRNSAIGGAFNILDQIVKSSEYLKTQTASCSGLNGPKVNCSAFNPQETPSGAGATSKVQAYWKAGFNPNSYFCSGSSGLSFYLPSQNQLYILGGIDGDLNSSDTDHFDNSVIIHEYAHFLEDQYAASDSPGGSHDGNSVLDPRLAWSEGWADFFQAAVQNQSTPVYQDTSGNVDGTTGNLFFLNLEFRCTTSNEGGSCSDFPTASGEGNFREFAITRALWDAIDSNADTFTTGGAFTDNFTMPFQEIWTAFLNLKDSSFNFRSVGLFHEIMVQLTGSTTTNFTDYTTLMSSSELNQPNRTDYANPIDFTQISCTTTLASSGTDLFKAHDFYDYEHPSTGDLRLDLSYTRAGSTSDVDLYLYKENHTLGTLSTILASSNSSSDGPSSSGGETISISNLSAGHYLIVVQYFAGPTNQAYNLMLTNPNNSTAVKICPKTSF